MFTLMGKHQHQTVVFPGLIKKKSCKISRILVLGLKISEECHTILWSFLRVKLCFVLNFQGSIKNPKYCRGVLKNDVLNHFGKFGWESRLIKKYIWSGAGNQKQIITENPPITSSCGCLIFRQTVYFVQLQLRTRQLDSHTRLSVC